MCSVNLRNSLMSLIDTITEHPFKFTIRKVKSVILNLQTQLNSAGYTHASLVCDPTVTQGCVYLEGARA